MAVIKSRTLFFFTSPRSPYKMLPEIEVLKEHFLGTKWNSETQIAFMQQLLKSDFFSSSTVSKDMALSARDRINRGPKALGLVDLNPVVALTPAGLDFLDPDESSEALTKQLLKFQLPSPYHQLPKQKEGVASYDFCVKPFLEILRLIFLLGKLTMDELMIFGLQLTNFNKFEHLVCKILMFRQRKKLTKLSYKAFVKDSLHQEICHIYQDEITHGRTTTRQSQDNCIDKFVRTKASNMQDYADACFRYLRATGLVHISQSGRSISIDESKYEDVMFILDSLPRTPVFVDDEQSYKQYLFDNNTPNLLTNDLEHLREKIAQIDRNFKACNIKEAKRQFSNIVQKRQQALIAEQVADLKSGVHTQDVLECFSDIKNK